MADVVFLQPAAETLERTAANAENWQGFSDSIVVPQVDLGVETILVFLSSCLLVKPVELSDAVPLVEIAARAR